MRIKTEKIAMGQIEALPTLEENLELAGKMIDEAADKGAKLILFPEVGFELFFPKFNHDVERFGSAQPIPGPITEFLCTKARENEIVVVASILEEGYYGEYYDAAVVIDADGTLLGTSRMMHIAESGEFNEKFYYAPGNTGWPVYDTAAGKIGVAICYDAYFPEAARCLTMNGAEIVLVPTCTSEGIGQALPPTDYPEGGSIEVIDFIMKSNAYCNGVFLGWCNRAGNEDGMEMSGRSRIYDPLGRILAKAGKEHSEVLIAELDFEKIRASRGVCSLLQDRRPDSYGAILKTFGSEPHYVNEKVTGREPSSSFSGRAWK